MCTKFWNTTSQKAFSLIELLISLIIISVVVAAFAPVMTKRLHKGSILIGSMKNLSITCDNPKCQICTKDKCILCKIGTNCPDGHLNTEDCSCSPCANSNCLVCLENGNCKSCKAGSGGVDCKKCQKGEYSLGDSIAICEKCPAGRYSDSIGSSSCTPCKKGFYQDKSGQETCNPCKKGSYQDELGQVSCKKCPDGKYQNLEGQASCKSCPENSVSNPDGIGCTCNEGYVFQDEKCVPCSEKFPGCKLCSEKGCSECNSEDLTIIGDGLACGRPPKSQEDCAPYNSVYVPYIKYQSGYIKLDDYGFCMTKYNAGDMGGPSIYTNKIKVMYYTSDERGRNISNIENTCWKPSLDKNYKAYEGCDKKEDLNKLVPLLDGMPKENLVERNAKYKEYDYSGCERTVCGENAAWFICNAHNISDTKAGYWSLPTVEQTSNLYTIINSIETKENPVINNFMGGDGLQLCSADYKLLCTRYNMNRIYNTALNATRGAISCLRHQLVCFGNEPKDDFYGSSETYLSCGKNSCHTYYFSKASLVTFFNRGKIQITDSPDGSKWISTYSPEKFHFSFFDFVFDDVPILGNDDHYVAHSVRCVLNYVPVK